MIAKKVRLTLELPVQANEELERLMERTHASSKTEVLRKAITLLELAVRARESGKRVGVADPGQPLATEFVGI